MPSPPDSRLLTAVPQPVRQLLEDIERTGPHGTSAVIGLYGRALEMLARESTDISGSELAERALALIDFFLNTRGRFTGAVTNSFSFLRIQLRDLPADSRGVEDVYTTLMEFSGKLEEDRQGRLDAVATAGAAELAGAECLLLYDYSSTVFKVVEALAPRSEELRLVVPESRTCNGGLPILRHGKALECGLWLIPDVTLAFALPKCDAVLVGVESFFSDGSFTNTVGSLTAAIAAKHFAVPFYAVTDLTKADQEGSRDIQALRTFSEPLAGHSLLDDEVGVEMTYPPLERVPGHLVTAYITENGVVKPGEVWSAAQSISDGGGA